MKVESAIAKNLAWTTLTKAFEEKDAQLEALSQRLSEATDRQFYDIWEFALRPFDNVVDTRATVESNSLKTIKDRLINLRDTLQKTIHQTISEERNYLAHAHRAVYKNLSE